MIKNLLIDSDIFSFIRNDELDSLKKIEKEFIDSWARKNPEISDKSWLLKELTLHLPEETPERIKEYTDEIVSTVEINAEKRNSLDKAISQGRSKEDWFAKEVGSATKDLGQVKTCEYLKDLDSSMDTSNENLYNSILTDNDVVNKNQNLDGFIAEQYHAETFNLNAKASGSQYRAEVLVPDGTYGKNSVDIVIKDSNGKIVSRYQSKYCKDPKATLEAFEKGDYRGQQKLVPADQVSEIKKSTKATDVIEAPDGTKSNPITKKQVKEMQEKAQTDSWEKMDWNEYQIKNVAKGIAKKAGHAALLGAAVTSTISVMKKVWNGEKIETSKVVQDAIKNGADTGIKVAASGALTTCVRRGMIKGLAKNTPVGVLATIADTGIESAKTLFKVAKGEITLKEGMNKIEQIAVSNTASLIAAGKGAAIGAKVGACLGPIGAAAGGAIGATVGSMIGSEAAKKAVKVVQAVREKVNEGIKKAKAYVKDKAKKVFSKALDFVFG